MLDNLSLKSKKRQAILERIEISKHKAAKIKMTSKTNKQIYQKKSTSTDLKQISENIFQIAELMLYLANLNENRVHYKYEILKYLI